MTTRVLLADESPPMQHFTNLNRHESMVNRFNMQMDRHDMQMEPLDIRPKSLAQTWTGQKSCQSCSQDDPLILHSNLKDLSLKAISTWLMQLA